MGVFADSARDALAQQDIAEVLVFQLKRAPDAERRHVILEILASLGESGERGAAAPSAAPATLSHTASVPSHPETSQSTRT